MSLSGLHLGCAVCKPSVKSVWYCLVWNTVSRPVCKLVTHLSVWYVCIDYVFNFRIWFCDRMSELTSFSFLNIVLRGFFFLVCEIGVIGDYEIVLLEPFIEGMKHKLAETPLCFLNSWILHYNHQLYSSRSVCDSSRCAEHHCTWMVAERCVDFKVSVICSSTSDALLSWLFHQYLQII